MKYTFKPKGICATKIEAEVEGNIVSNVKYTGGCPGNHLGIEALVEGMDIDEVIKRLNGIPCRGNTSCPDQLAKMLTEIKAGNL